ncbi:MAG TPA: 3-phosphoshikimate 1-carboxyvinyltransferase [Elusimicrobiales bacterium]|nr:3-phosphoshikimate 1-carboxyvinyltransferase [Elusimicrobiales bacterium]HOL62785.1 3-phosphoshikimate 1-carboxyvinyltransferase [Elusimicrobiales bacterium]HPO95834.1 3-phosphoshikimate 1-carboxyvinyltransferase [Elusimicrobiales bacterium]
MEKIIYTPPPDKSITIRALILSSISEKKIKIRNPLISEDTLNTVRTLKKLGSEIKTEKNIISVKGFGKYGAKKAAINVGESALLLRLLLPILIHQKYSYKITGKKTILRRSSKDTVTALKKMGAEIIHNNYKLPFTINPSILKPLNFEVKSAQTKSALLIASLYSGKIIINDKYRTRDHTERLLDYFGMKIKKKKNMIWLENFKIKPKDIQIPNDISQASVFITLAILSGKEIIVKNCGINPTRIGFLNSLKKMGVKIKYKNKKILSAEPVADILVKPTKKIKPITIKDITSLIDEVMLLSLIAAKADGITRISNAKSLSNKESDRLKEIYNILKKLGVKVNLYVGKLTIEGPSEFKNINFIDTKGDHRIAMIAGIIKKTINPKLKIKNPNCVKKTYPYFWKDLTRYV